MRGLPRPRWRHVSHSNSELFVCLFVESFVCLIVCLFNCLFVCVLQELSKWCTITFFSLHIIVLFVLIFGFGFC